MLLKCRTKRALKIGVGLTALQLFVALQIAQTQDPTQGPVQAMKRAYANLCHWDCSDWYQNIVTEGYHSPVPPLRQNPKRSNVAFFPGYPLIARGVSQGIGASPRIALILVSQIFSVLFWAGLWIFMRYWRLPPPLASLVLLAVFSHPASFFLITGYSESLFLSTLLLFILNTSSSSTKGRVSSAVSGVLMSSSRIIGLPVVLLPILQNFSPSDRKKGPGRQKLLRALSVSVPASLGALGFFAYCQFRFGSYDLYMQTQRIGWGIIPDYGAILKWTQFTFRYPIDRMATYASIGAFGMLVTLELLLSMRGGVGGFRRRLPLYLTAFVIFYITVSGLKSVQFLSMIRYSLPWCILLLLCLADAISRFSRTSHRFPKILSILVGVALALGLSLILYRVQLPHLRDYLNGHWYA